MAPRKPKATEPATSSPVKSARVIKTRSSNATSAVKNPSVTATPPKHTYCVKRYEDGMLNLEQTPEHLVGITKRNATDSPLLRLPPEIRNHIWSFAVGGQLIAFPMFSWRKGLAIQIDQKPNASDLNTYEFGLRPNHFHIKRLPASFHVPEVCRQIYSEAALTAYQQNVFFNNGQLKPKSKLFDCLMEVQKRTIKSVEIGPPYLHRIMINCQYAAPMTDNLPNLEHILVSAPALEFTLRGLPTLQIKDTQEGQKDVLQRLRKVLATRSELSSRSKRLHQLKIRGSV